jgi:alkylation response protein AidB-like acyl-CoA dehydrogenase
LIIDNETPGISVHASDDHRRTHERRLFDNVRVRDRLVGELNEGWRYIGEALTYERFTMASVVPTQRKFGELVEWVKMAEVEGKALRKDPIIRRKIAHLSVLVEMARMLDLRCVCLAVKPDYVPYIEAMMNKMWGGIVETELGDTALDILSPYGYLWKDPDAPLDGVRWTTTRAGHQRGGGGRRHSETRSRGAIWGCREGRRPAPWTWSFRAAEAARRYRAPVREECPLSAVRGQEDTETGFSPELWQKMAGLGWLGLPFPEQYGGYGLGNVDLALLSKEMGCSLCPSPYIPSVVLAGGAILAGGAEEQKSNYLRVSPPPDRRRLRDPGADAVLGPARCRLPRDRNGRWLGPEWHEDVRRVRERRRPHPRRRPHVREKPSKEGVTMFLVDAQRRPHDDLARHAGLRPAVPVEPGGSSRLEVRRCRPARWRVAAP